MIKFFYATGDSFVFGHELTETGPEEDDATLFNFTPYKRTHCYTGIMANSLKTEDYQNSACPGGSNERAYRMLINDLTCKLKTYKPEEIFVNISVTMVTRREFCFNSKGDYYIHMQSWEPPKDCNPHHHALWKTLVKDFHYDHGDFMFDIMILLGMQNFLKNNKIPYLITSSMGVEHYKQEQIISVDLLNQIYRKRYYVYPSFFKFASDNGHKIGPGMHPLEEGHANWASHLLNENNLLDNSDL